jgi:hypothetical protein
LLRFWNLYLLYAHAISKTNVISIHWGIKQLYSFNQFLRAERTDVLRLPYPALWFLGTVIIVIYQFSGRGAFRRL